ncbi:MAG: hypothetical protein ACE5FZ_05945 [Nitrospiria bacterium]
MEQVIGVLSGDSESEKLEVFLNSEEGDAGRLHIRLLSWGEGIGWYSQKTIELDCRNLANLQTLCKKAEAHLRTERRKTPRSSGKVISFPTNRPGSGSVLLPRPNARGVGS